MPCYHPMQAYLPVPGSASKKVIFNPDIDHGAQVNLPCGQCIGCRLEYSRQWAVRCVHESKLYQHNCFITLTFDSENLPKDESLDVKVFQDFMKRFRKRVRSKSFIDKYGFYCKKLRFFHCGEYGEIRGRPHYHACIFNFDFPDRKYYKTRKGVRLYTSEELSSLWPFGFCSVGDVTFESAAYVARYVTKKITGKAKDCHYRDIGVVDEDTGEVFAKKQEYTTMSRRPGIGKDYYSKFKDDFYPSDMIVIRNDVKCKPPKYYDSLYEQDDECKSELLKLRRVDNMDRLRYDYTESRLKTREVVKKAQLSLYGKRDLE